MFRRRISTPSSGSKSKSKREPQEASRSLQAASRYSPKKTAQFKITHERASCRYMGCIGFELQIINRDCIIPIYYNGHIQDVSKVLYNFESLYKFTQRTCTVFLTVTM
jgi:hypothetical protein